MTLKKGSGLADATEDPHLVQSIAEVIINNSSAIEERQDFWSKAGLNLLAALIHYVIRREGDDGKLLPIHERCLGAICRLLSSESFQSLEEIMNGLPKDHPARAPYGIFKLANRQIWGNIAIGLGCNDQFPLMPLFSPVCSTTRPYSQTRSNTQRALMQPDEIQRMDNKQCIVLLRGQKPMLLYKIIPDEFSAFQRLRPTPVGEHIPEWRKHLSSAPEVKAEAPKQEAPPPPPETKPASEKKEQRSVPDLEYDFTGEDGGLGMVEKTVNSMLGEDEPEEG